MNRGILSYPGMSLLSRERFCVLHRKVLDLIHKIQASRDKKPDNNKRSLVCQEIKFEIECLLLVAELSVLYFHAYNDGVYCDEKFNITRGHLAL